MIDPEDKVSFPYFRPPWSLADVIIIILLVYICELAFLFLGRPLIYQFPELGNPELVFFLAAGFLQVILLVGFVLGCVHLRKAPFAALGLGRLSWSDLFNYGVVGGMGVFLLVTTIMAVMISFFPQPPQPQPLAELIMSAGDWRGLLLPLLLVGVGAPLSEELYFRGFVYPVLRSRIGVAWGIIITACFFAALHFDPVRFFPLALGGAFLTYFREKTGSLYPSLAAHSVWNVVMTFFAFYSGQAL